MRSLPSDPEDPATRRLKPPAAAELPVRHRHHGIVREDPWHWLRERDNPAVLAHLREENAYTAAAMADAGDLPERLFHELLGRIEESNRSAVYPEGAHLYQSRIKKGQDYRVWFRKPRTGDGPWKAWFDANAEAAGKPYFDLGFLDVSPDGRMLAYAVDTAGEERFTLRFRDLATGRDLPQRVEDVSAEGEWDAASRCYFFIREDETRRPDRVFRYRVGDDPAAAVQVYAESDPRFFTGLEKSQDGRFLFAVSESKETTEVHFLRADDPQGAFQPAFPRREGIQYELEHHAGHWLLRTNENAPDFQLLRLPAGDSTLDRATVLAPPRDGVRLTGILPLRHHLLLFERANGLDRIEVRDLRDGAAHTIAMRDAVYDLQPAANAEFDTVYFNFTYSSPVRPPLTFRYNLETRQSEILREVRVPSGHDPGDYTVYRIQAPSADGTPVPMTVVHRRELPLDGANPAYLYGYGAYGETIDACFRSDWLTWLERGCVVAIAHVRGGGLLGERWYQDGKLDNKENSFHDFIACAEALCERGFTGPGQLLIEGGSAGGLLVGAVLNRRPELFRAAVAEVPFVDVLNTMLDPELPLTTHEYEEWGDPGEKAFFAAIMAYSPYENVRDAVYPALLVTAGFNDPRVPYWEAAKWVARLRKHQLGSAPVLLKTLLDAGHMGATGRYDSLRETAFTQAFLLHQLPARK
jgi:oligopeptidase B